ncbi:YwpF-like family protein [Lederbergia panacisoli]|uniref:YwpF-like family protein n=1 Tax=Lederbergia panacisoli TaxID=1255251 RepID=UPI00214B892A|nr:YwpF-like family protein [Lederbergia panacisoli]MCR2821394.1 YwpF-like family protein [Lederbergia panacisoli]
MKTFKIVALHIYEEKRATNIPLKDGLIINKENEDGVWIIEAYIEKQYIGHFQKRFDNEESFEIRVIITHAANDPAPFTVKVHTIQVLDDHISVLFQGRLSKRRNEYPEILLDDLIKEGLSGDQLLEEFRKRMKKK